MRELEDMKNKPVIILSVVLVMAVAFILFIGQRANRKSGGRVEMPPVDRYGDFVEGQPSSSEYSEGLTRIKGKNDRYGFMDKAGKLVIGYDFFEADNFSEGLAAVRNEKGHGYIDRTGKWIIKSDYLDIKSFSEGLAAVQVMGYGSRWGYINQQGKMVIPAELIKAYDFKDGKARVMNKEHKYVYIDKYGNTVNN